VRLITLVRRLEYEIRGFRGGETVDCGLLDRAAVYVLQIM
jgi:hypothetical protein